ncbi:Uma2 family endonuclease [Cylindrospermopsis sp. CR12]|uniref:Uma2 family endonuclease n=1 Tax=Cylindrospermopsis sp. CR12 TaxID=1747196 RepID=UPI00070A63DA|nr:Uma2 family endonuclease [Cylindrospermopsis sp. CR12]KRH97640.1 hypothetical protein ASL19_15105 [Cylindrospermopsis sp. CR12]
MTVSIIEQKKAEDKPKKVSTPEEYLSLEEKAEYKHEYRNGEIVAMVGGTTNHNEIVTNLCTTLKVALKGQHYRVFIGDVRLWIPRYNQYTYPDVMVISGDPVYYQGKTTITNPLLIIEVLSQSTQDYDRGTKFTHYRSIPELQEYILVDQYSVNIEQFTKTSQGQWLLTEYEKGAETFSMQSLKLQLKITDIYEQVEFA